MLDGTQDVAYSRIYRQGTAPIAGGECKVTVFENDKLVKEVFFTVK